MHRLTIDEPYSLAAIWSWRLAFFGFCVATIGVLTARYGLEPLAVLAILVGAMSFAGLSILLSLVAINMIWRTGRKGTAHLSLGLLLATCLLSFPIYLAVQAFRLPFLNDISTDLKAPPLFSRSRAALIARGLHTPEGFSSALRESQKLAYPAVETIRLDLDAVEAFEILLKVTKSSEWEIVEIHPPGGRMGHGHIDAIARSGILNFADDIAIRLRPSGDETLIDIRSVSRLGPPDFGGNAKRIENFISLVQSEADKSS
jgi:uncharacterized protein (DUF1499 family)